MDFGLFGDREDTRGIYYPWVYGEVEPRQGERLWAQGVTPDQTLSPQCKKSCLSSSLVKPRGLGSKQQQVVEKGRGLCT